MKKALLNILTVSAIITTIGFLMDGDTKEPSMLMRFMEFAGMIGVIFTLISLFYFAFISRNRQKI